MITVTEYDIKGDNNFNFKEGSILIFENNKDWTGVLQKYDNGLTLISPINNLPLSNGFRFKSLEDFNDFVMRMVRNDFRVYGRLRFITKVIDENNKDVTPTVLNL